MKNEHAVEFRYEELNEREQELARGEAEKIHDLLNRSCEATVEIGQSLIKVHQKIGKRQFQDWLNSEFRWAQPTASNFMQIAKRFGKLNCLERFQPSALCVLVRKNVPEKALREAIKLARAGETITHKRAKELIRKHDSQARGSNGRSDRPVLELMGVPTDLDALNDSLDTFCDRVKSIAVELSKTEREGLADQLLDLALALRTCEGSVNPRAEEKPPVTKPKARARTSKPALEPIAV